MPNLARTAFDTNIVRAGYFLDIHEATQPGRGAPELPRRELPRASLVFAVGAMDAYISDISAEVLLAQLRQRAADGHQREILKKIQQEIPTLSLEVALLDQPRERLDRIRSAIVEHFYENVSAIGVKAIAGAVQRMGKRPADLWAAIAGRGYASPAENIDQAAEMRHRIIHRGERPRLTREAARELIALTQEVVHAIDTYAEEILNPPPAA